MALIRLGPVVADIRGSIGGSVFARNAAGNYIRNRTKPVYPGSVKQSQRTALMSSIVADWQGTLTNAQRIAWNDHAKATTLRNRLGMDFTPSGFNLYARSNFYLDLCSQSHITAPPAHAVTPALSCTLDYLEGTGCRITAIDGFDTTTGADVLMFQAPNKFQSRFFFKGPWDSYSSPPVTFLDTLPDTIRPEAICDQGKRFWFRFVVVDTTGEVSAETIYYVDRAAA